MGWTRQAKAYVYKDDSDGKINPQIFTELNVAGVSNIVPMFNGFVVSERDAANVDKVLADQQITKYIKIEVL